MIKNRLVLIDAYALIFRAYYSIPPHFSDKKGRPTNAAYGFTAALLTAIKDLKPEYLAIGIDVGKSIHREEYEKYKANRPPAPDDLKIQVPIVLEIAKAMNIPLFGHEGFEGEDIIATIINKLSDVSYPLSDEKNNQTVEKQLSENGKPKTENIIVTGDMDTLQLVDASTKVYISGRNGQPPVLYDEEKVKERYSLTPAQFVDYKALRGDPSDNIPGVPGIGEKGACSFISTYGSLDKLYENLDKLSDRNRKILEDNKELAYLSQKLATIQKNAPIEFNLKDARIHDYDQKKVIALFEELGFRSLIPRLHEELRPPDPQQSLF